MRQPMGGHRDRAPRGIERGAQPIVIGVAGGAGSVAIARPRVAVLARYAARFSVRANDVTVDASLLWVGTGLAIAAAVLLAYVPKLPSADGANGAIPRQRRRAHYVWHEPAPAGIDGGRQPFSEPDPKE